MIHRWGLENSVVCLRRLSRRMGCRPAGHLTPSWQGSIQEPQLFLQEKRSTRWTDPCHLIFLPCTICEDIQWESASLVSLHKLLTFLEFSSSKLGVFPALCGGCTDLHPSSKPASAALSPVSGPIAHSEEDKGLEELWEMHFDYRNWRCLGLSGWNIF